MQTTPRAGTGSTAPGVDSNPTLTTALLLAGSVAGPIFIVVGTLQALTRTGFSMRDHPMSLLSLGDFGWIQITNFVVSGLLIIAFALGLRTVIRSGRGATWGPRFIALFGIGLIAGGLFVADPALGFPPGTPDGSPESLSWHGILHAVAFAVAFPALIVACFIFARRFFDLHQRGWAVYSLLIALSTLILTVIFQVTEVMSILWISSLISLTWPTALAWKVSSEHRVERSATEPAMQQAT